MSVILNDSEGSQVEATKESLQIDLPDPKNTATSIRSTMKGRSFVPQDDRWEVILALVCHPER